MSGYKSQKNTMLKRQRFDMVILIVIAALIAIFAFEATNLPVSYAVFRNSMDRPLMTEIMSSNSGTITNEDGKYCDWIEIHNPSSHPVNLAGFTMTDNPQIPAKYVLPYWVLLPGEYAIVYADDQPSTDAELHLPFKLKDKGEILILFDPNGEEIQRISFPAMEDNHSYSLDMDTLEWASTDICTPGFSNTDDGYTAFLQTRRAESPVAINELMAVNTITLKDEDGDYSDWVELYNSALEPIDLTGWGLSDTEASPKRWEFPETEIDPGEYLVVFLSGKNRADAGQELHTDFRLNRFDDILLLSNYRGQIVSQVQIGNLSSDTSYGLTPETGQWQVYAQPTPGYPNTTEGWNMFQEILYSDTHSPVVISEVMSSNVSTLQDQSGEYPDWIELYNRSSEDVDLSGWGLTDDTEALGRWRFPSVTLSPGEYLTVYASGRDSIASNTELHTDFSIGSEGDIIVLTGPEGKATDFCYIPMLRTGQTYQRRQDDPCFVFCGHPTPGGQNADGCLEVAAKPAYSIPAGMYDEALQVELRAAPGFMIYYTIDGTTPNENGIPYTGPIQIETTTAVRAVACREGYLPSDAACATYLIGENIHLPVVSIVTDPANLFDEETGIYVDGPGWTPEVPHRGANYWQDWERPAHMELLEPDGTVGISQDIGIKIFGAYSRAKDQKSFALMSRGRYGNRTFDYRIFPDLPYTDYKNLIIRNSAQDANMTRIRDHLQGSLAQETANIDSQAHRQSVLFINGEFWGVYDIMEKINEHFLALHHGVSPDKIDMVVANGDVVMGSNQDYLALLEYVKSNDLSIQNHYDYVASQIDIDSYIDWCTIEMYIANHDLKNVKIWRPQTPGGKWRWILYDLDWGYLHLFKRQHRSRLNVFKSFLHPEGSGQDHVLDNTLVLGLLANTGFKQRFLERFFYHCTVTFESDKVLARIDELASNIEPYMQRDMDKWTGNTVETWKQEHLALIKEYARKRPMINLHHMKQYFGLSAAEMMSFLSQQEAGYE